MKYAILGGARARYAEITRRGGGMARFGDLEAAVMDLMWSARTQQLMIAVGTDPVFLQPGTGSNLAALPETSAAAPDSFALGPFIGAAVFLLLENLVSLWTVHWQLVVGAAFIVCVLFFPRGIWGSVLHWAEARGAR